jgi:hypothetical protein
MVFESSLTNIAQGDQVRFKEERLCMLTSGDRKRLSGRVGVVQGYWNFTRKLTVLFPQDADRALLRILSVDPRQLERVVDGDTPTEGEPEIADEASGDAKLSQEDTDNLFG